MRISPKYMSNDWKKLALTATSTLENWKKGVAIFDNRYNYRFIKQINTLSNNILRQTGIYSGFAVMAINCLLIETLNQFYYGVNDTNELKNTKSIKQISSIEDSFVDFFNNSKYFQTSFNQEISKLFYQHIRCGLLHQAEIKMTSTIHIGKKQKEIVEKICEGKTVTGISVRRDLFTECLIAEYNNYKKLLLETPLNYELRSKFILKMDLICNDKN